MGSNSYIFTEKANNDLELITTYILDKLNNPVALKKLLESIENKINMILSFPECCPIIDNDQFNKRGIRKAVIDNYRLYYLYQEESHTIVVLCIIHCKRKIDEIV